MSANTVAAYARDLRRFGQWLGGRNVTRLSIQDLADYAGWLHRKGLAPASIARHVISLKVFFRYLQLEGLLRDNLAEQWVTRLGPWFGDDLTGTPAQRGSFRAARLIADGAWFNKALGITTTHDDETATLLAIAQHLIDEGSNQ